MRFKKEDVEFRVAGNYDAHKITDLVNSVYRGDNSKKGWTTEADLLGGIRITTEIIIKLIEKPDSVIIIALHENEIIGCVHLEKRGEACYLGMLSVNVNFQNSGLGKLIMDESERYARNEFRSGEMTMKVIGQRKELIEYYERKGYTPTGIKETFAKGKHIGDIKVEGLYFLHLSKKL